MQSICKMELSLLILGIIAQAFHLLEMRTLTEEKTLIAHGGSAQVLKISRLCLLTGIRQAYKALSLITHGTSAHPSPLNRSRTS
uniref:Uncharacterized protein n=1 Tax=uncultured marine virus TaxID=186617 RepID=A0A0F7L7L3_9VIRU|nr:hypothetical protein Psyc_1014 [uncultured marine virus]